MTRFGVQSSNVESIGYDKSLRILEVAFHHGGVYQYVGVPPRQYRAFLRAPSKGRFLAHAIKPRYAFRKIQSFGVQSFVSSDNSLSIV